MNNKLIALLLALVLAVTLLTACGKGGEGDETTTGDTAATSDVTAAEPFTPEEDVNADVVSVSTENYSLTNADVSYLFYMSYGELLYNLQSSGFSPSLVGLDMTVSLKDQTCGIDSSGVTWYEYVMNSAKSEAESLLTLCEAAKAEGVELDDEDTASVSETIDEIKKYAEEEDETVEEYVKIMYGPSVRIENVEKMLKLNILAVKYVNEMMDRADTSDAALEAKYQEYKNNYETFDYVAYGFNYSDMLSEGAGDAERADAINKVNTYAAQMEACTDADSFIALAKQHMIEELEMTEAEADAASKKLLSTDVKYTGSGETTKWAAESEVGDVRRVDDGEGVVSLYLLAEKNGRVDEETLRSVRHILFMKSTYSTDEKVNEVYNAWVSGGASVEEFASLAAEYSEDPGSAASGGLYEGVTKGQMVEEINDWLFDEARVPGDHAIVETEQFGWHIMYYEGKTSQWKYDMKGKILSETSTSILKDAKAKWSVSFDDEILATISA